MSRSNFNWPLWTEVPDQGLVYGPWPWRIHARIHTETYIWCAHPRTDTHMCQRYRCWHTNQIAWRWEGEETRRHIERPAATARTCNGTYFDFKLPSTLVARCLGDRISNRRRESVRMCMWSLEHVQNTLLHKPRTWQTSRSTPSTARWRWEARTWQEERMEWFLNPRTLEKEAEDGKWMDEAWTSYGCSWSVWGRSGWACITLSLTELCRGHPENVDLDVQAPGEF